MEGACAGEKITLIVPPELAYGDSPSDKVICPKGTIHNEFFCLFTTFLMSTCCEVAPGSTLYFLTSLNGIVRVTKQTTGKGNVFTKGKKRQQIICIQLQNWKHVMGHRSQRRQEGKK
jgi:FKBP-type peptidyl-prolyl cis-trans isomerase